MDNACPRLLFKKPHFDMVNPSNTSVGLLWAFNEQINEIPKGVCNLKHTSKFLNIKKLVRGRLELPT
jgi:hypothetical protein